METTAESRTEEDIRAWVKTVEAEQYLEHETGNFLVLGVSRGDNRGCFGDDAMAVRELPKNGGLMMAVVDFPPYDVEMSPRDYSTTASVRDSRLVAEAVAHKLVTIEAPQTAARAADARMDQLLKDKRIALKKVKAKGILSAPFARVKLTADERDRKVLEVSLARGDVSVIAFIPDENGKFSLDSIIPIHFNPQNDERLNNPAPVIPEDEFALLLNYLQDTMPKGEYIFRNSVTEVLPPGSFVVVASDGGLFSLVEPGVLTAVGGVDEEKLKRSFNIMTRALEREMDRTDALYGLKFALKPLLEILNRPAPLFHLKKLLRAVQSTPQLDDDATVVMAFVKSEKLGEGKKQKIPEFSRETYPLLMELAGAAESLPLDTDKLLEKYGREAAILLVEELIEQSYTEFPRDHIFADACALVRIDWLPDKIRQWFEQRGLTVVDGENIRVHLRHEKETRYGLGGCHEVGNLILYGEPGTKVVHIDTEKEPPGYVARNAFREHETNKRFPRGAWADVNVWGRLRFTVCGGYVAGTGPNARGILVPAGEIPIVYINTENSFIKGLPERNFYIRQGGINQYAAYGLYALGKYLKGEIPALTRGEIQK